MSDWKIIVPLTTVNEIFNPSFEVNVTDNWAIIGGPGLVSVNTQQVFGVLCANLGGGANTLVQSNIINIANNETVTASVYADLFGPTGTITLIIRDTTNGLDRATAASTAPVTGWSRIDTTWTNTTGGAVNVAVRLDSNIPVAIAYVDAVQLERQTALTTYCDGDQPGCEWLGLPHNSSSQRSAVSRAGGLIADLADDLDFKVGAMIATGMAPLDLHVDQYAILPGGQLNSIKVLPNILTLTGVFYADDKPDLHAKRQGMINAVKPDLVPETEEGAQPILLRYEEEPAVDKEIEVHYHGGLEGNIDAKFECSEDLAIRFLAPDPFWHEIGESAIILNEQDIDTSSYIAGRVNGVWDMFGSPAVAAATTCYAVVWGPDGNLYIGGSFVNFGPPGAHRIAMWDPVTRVWTALQTGATDNSVRALVFGPDGTLYAGGDFTSMDNGGGAVANTDGIASWDGVNWAPVGTGVNAPGAGVFALVFGQDGFLYAGGNFAGMSGVANTVRIARWNGVIWAAMNLGISNNAVFAIDIAPDGTVYIGGSFNVTAAYIAYWDGAAWQNLGTGANNDVNAIAVDVDGNVYAGGTFTTMDGNAALRLAVWNGTSWVEVGGGFTNTVRALHFAPDGKRLYVGGLVGKVGGIGIVWWDGSAWGHLDYRPSGVLDVHAIEIGALDPVVNQNYDIYIGHDIQAADNAFFAGNVVVANDGTTSVFPTFVVERDGVQTATLLMLRNETTGRELLFNYALADGERLTVNLTPTEKSVVSSIVGNQPQAVFANSDFGEWSLLPGNNLVTLLVYMSAAPPSSVTAWLNWRDTYWSFD